MGPDPPPPATRVCTTFMLTAHLITRIAVISVSIRIMKPPGPLLGNIVLDNNLLFKNLLSA